MARKFSLRDMIGGGSEQGKLNKFKDVIKTKWNVNLNLGNALRKRRTDTSIQRLKDDVSRALEGDMESLKRVKEYTLKRKLELSMSMRKEEIHVLQDAEFIHQILTECDQISPQAAILNSEKISSVKLNGSVKSVTKVQSKSNSEYELKSYMLSIIACDLISLEESQKNPIHMPKAEQPDINQCSSIMQEVFQIPKELIQELEKNAHKSTEYGFNLSVSLLQAQNSKDVSQEASQPSELYCRVGYLSKEAIEQKKVDLETKGTNVHKTQLVPNSCNPVWDEQYKLPFLSKADYLLVELWQTKSKKKSAKSSDEYLGRCLIKLEPHMEEIVQHNFEITTVSGKVTSWTILMSMKIIATSGQLKFIAHHDITEKWDIYRCFLSELTHYLNRKKYNVSFNKFTEPFEQIKLKLIEMLELNDFQVRAAAFENSEIWSKSNQLNCEDIETSIALLNSHWDTKDNILSTVQKVHLVKEISNMFEKETNRLEGILTEFPPNESESKPCVEALMSIAFGSYTFLLSRGELAHDYDINKEITKILIKGINAWFKDKSLAVLNKTSPKTQLESLLLLCDCILLLMEAANNSYKDAISAANIDYANLIVFTIDKRMSNEIQDINQIILRQEPKIGKELNKLYFLTFALYRKISTLLKKVSLDKSALDTFKLSNIDDWFQIFLNYWVQAMREVSMENIEKTIEIESEGTHEYRGMKVSSSAIDIALCLLPSHLLYTKLEDWGNSQDRFSLAMQTIQLNMDALLKYSQIMNENIKKYVGGPNLTTFELNTDICIMLNNAYSIRHHLEEAPKRMHWERLKSSLEDESQKSAIDQLINGCLDKVSEIECESINAIGIRFRGQFDTLFKEFIAYSQSESSTEDAIDSLMKWLLRNVNTAIQDLCPDLFLPLLEEMWRQALDCICSYKDPNKSKGSNNKILESLVILLEFFDNDGKGISTEKINGTIYDSLVDHFSLYLQDSHELMMAYGREVSELCRREPTKYGSCNFSAAYLIDKEELEINIIQIERIPSPGASGSISIYLQPTILPRYDAKSFECKTELRKYEQSMVIEDIITIPVAKLAMENGFLLQVSLYYRSTHKIGLYSEYVGSIFLPSEEIGEMKSTGSLVDLLTGKNEVRKPIKMSFIVDPGESEILSILRERKSEDIATNSFVECISRGVKDGNVMRKLTDGVEGTKKFLNKFRK